VTSAGELSLVSGSVGDTRSEVCWAVVTNDNRFAFVTNFGDGTVSSYEVAPDGGLTLRDPVAGSTREGEKGVRDEALSSDGRYLYAIDADAHKLFGWAVGTSGELTPACVVAGLPDTVAGLAAG
jgi:6-phosphogluconolactonase (cycloisomerase 2 family)